jgi:DNA-binding transcriptional MerR regulator
VVGVGRTAPDAKVVSGRVDQPDPQLSIGEFARRTRLSLKALRLYDRLGLLVPDEVDRASGYRRYRQSQLATARLVMLLRRLDMPLADVAEVLDADGPQRAERLAAYWSTVERRVASQRTLVDHLRIRLTGGEGQFDMYEVKQRDVPEQVVISEQRHVLVPELAVWIPAAMDRLMKSAADVGGLGGPGFVIYYGEVNEDSDGPVEVCLPVNGPLEPAPSVAMRLEPAHREAYVRITKAQVEYPQILSAFDAVSQWISAQGLSNGAPREVYFADFAAAAPTDEVCDVAFPIEPGPARR